MELPVVAGEWRCAALLRSIPQRNEPIIAGCAVWHSNLVGNAARDMASLIAEMEDMGAGPIHNVASEEQRNYGLRLIGRYDWDYYSGGAKNDALPATSELKIDDDQHCVFLGDGFGGSFQFVDAKNYWSTVHPSIRARLVASNFFPSGLSTYSSSDSNAPPSRAFGMHIASPGSEYTFGRVWLTKDDKQQNDANVVSNVDGWLGAKAMIWFTYNIGEFFGELSVGLNAPVSPTPPG